VSYGAKTSSSRSRHEAHYVSHPTGRAYFRSYRVRRANEHAFLIDAVERSGGRCIQDSGPRLAPFYMSVQDHEGAIDGLLIYPFSAGHQEIRHRPENEHRLQIKYGDITEEWRQQDHGIGFDPMVVDVTLVVAVHQDAGLIIGLDPLTYDPLPMGIQVGFKASDVSRAQGRGWHVWERPNRPGRRRDPRAIEGFETIVAFRPERFLDYVALERQAQTMHLDPALRFAAAEAAATQRPSVQIHDLERAYDLTAHEILEIVSERTRLAVALRGGVAEHHLGRHLRNDPAISRAEVGTQDGPPDYWVSLVDGQDLSIECKNASPKTYRGGIPKAEVQKTRASRGDPLSRFYSVDAFDLLAVCLWGPTKEWTFRYKRTADLERHPDHSDRIAPMQRIDSSWATSVVDALAV
jgi:hypothetical protein